MSTQKEEFLQKLKSLLTEYRVGISFSVGSCSDTHGLYDEKMVISHRIDPKNFKEEDWLEVDGWNIGAVDIPTVAVDTLGNRCESECVACVGCKS